jgi:hypothetical protein
VGEARDDTLAACFPGAAMRAGRERTALLSGFVALLALSTFAFQFLLRSADDNRLVSWHWVFAPGDLFPLLPLVGVGMLAAYILSRRAWIARHAAPLIAALAFLATIPFWSEPEVIPDAARYFTQAKHFALSGFGSFQAAWGREIPAWTDLPLVPMLYGTLFGAAGEARLAVQIFNSLLFAGTAVLAYLIGKLLWARSTGIDAAVLLLGVPYLLTQVPLMLVDAATMFFVTLAAFAAIAALERGGRLRIAGAAAALALALLAKYSAWIALAIPPLLALSLPSHERSRALLRAGTIVLGGILLAGAFLAGRMEVVADQLALLWSYQVPALAGWQESAVSTFLFQIHPFVTLAALGSAVLAFRRGDSRLAAIGAIVLLAIVLGGRRIRYLVIVMPLLALMAANGLRLIRSLPTRRFVAACAVASSLVVALSGYLPFLRATSAANLEQAGALLDTLDGDSAEVIVLAATRSTVNPAIAVPLLDLHTRKQVAYRRDLAPLRPPPPEALALSPVRFTWELPTATFHLAPPGQRAPVVLVMSAPDQPLPPAAAERLADYSEAWNLAASDGVFRYQTLVRIYRPT